MKRLLLQVTFVVSLLLTVATAALWATSFWTTYTVEFERYGIVDDGWPYAGGWICMRPRMVVVAWWGNRSLHGTQPRNRFDLRLERDPATSDELAPRQTIWEKLGFKHAGQSVQQHASHVLWIPSWLVIGCCAATTALAIRPLRTMRRRRARAANGLCPACGYDLRGAQHARCPECGADVVAAVGV